MIDDKWFKAQQRKVGATTEDIARRANRARSAVSNIYTGRQRMTLDWARVFSEVLQQPIDEVLRRAGATNEATAQALAPGYADSDVVLWKPYEGGPRQEQMIADTMLEVLGSRAGTQVWQIKTSAMTLQGYLPGDFLLIKPLEIAQPGDVVIARVHDNARGKAPTLLRRFEPPVLVASSSNPEERRVYVVDGVNVVIRGKVIASWRME